MARSELRPVGARAILTLACVTAVALAFSASANAAILQPQIVGEAKSGKTVSCIAGVPLPANTAVSILWNHFETGPSGGSTFALSDIHIGTPLACFATLVNTVTNTVIETIRAKSVSPVGTRPVNEEPPEIEGTPRIGRVVTCDPGFWSHFPSAYKFRWTSDGELVSRKRSYTVASSDRGNQLVCEVRAQNPWGKSATVPSDGVTATKH